MKKSTWFIVTSLFLSLSLPAARAADDSGQPPDAFQNLKFRDLGPASGGGRVSSVVGVPGDPSIYYVGSAAGGVWKTTDGGLSFKAVFEREATASIGAIALAPSNPNLVWVGTGEANIRNDVMDGAGVYFSPDAGKSWQFMGLKDAGQISRVIVDPRDPDTVWVAVLGHTWKANPERGVFKTTDGGKTWKKVLSVSENTGATDLVISPSDPKVLFAAMWQVVRHPWGLVDGGPESSIWRSTDGGDTWKKLTKDLPTGDIGRIALAVAPSDMNRVYALIEAKHGEGLLWSSNDMGDDWSKVNSSYNLDVRPFYFSRMAVSPDDADRVYFLSFFMMLSKDGGRSAKYADRGVHVDHHAIWIDPTNPKRIIQGNDGGAYLSLDGAQTWRFLDGMPIEQDYMVSANSKSPYDLCAGLQDNSAWCGPSSTLADDSITGNDWFQVTGGDGEYTAFAPSNPDVVYVDSQDGAISSFNVKTKRSIFIMPYLHGPGFNMADTTLADAKYRFNWTSPIAVSAGDANTLYLGGNVLFKSTDGGVHWTVLGGDLTRNDKSKQGLSGGPVNKDITGAESYDTILSITLAPTDEKVIWLGTDDGLVQLSRDGGQTWNNVTPSGAPEWTRVYQVGVSPFDAGTAYVAFDGHELDDKHAYVYKTDNYGKSWTKIDKGLPDSPVTVVREDPKRKGLLVLGNLTGLWYSRDAGANWQQLKAGFPTVPVFDLKFVNHDLAVATHGRGLFVFDDLRAIEQLDQSVTAQDFHLFGAGDGIHYIRWSRGGETATTYSAPNAPDGVVVDYYLKKEIKNEGGDDDKTPVKIVVTDSRGAVVATKYGPSKQGVNRYVWEMQYDAPTKTDFEKKPDFGGGFGDFGPSVIAGTYNIAVTVNGKTETTTAAVAYDPNQDIPADQIKAYTTLALKARNQLSAYNEMLNRLVAMQSSLKGFEDTVDGYEDADKAKYKAAVDAAKALDKKLKDLKDSVYNSDEQKDAPEDYLHFLAKLDIQLQALFFGSAGSDPQPMLQSITDLDAELTPKVNDALGRFNTLLQKDVPDYNKAAFGVGAPTLLVGDPVAVKPVPAL
ncbi:MAG TPA: hypothetical protein VGT99_02530 [Gammaproteobacteria bacterium]|nr:hypothetical protein [Gammaproteobacteria bacterium]